MAKQTFSTGQILTAAQMISLQQTAMLGGAASAKTASYTLVAADAGTAISMTSASATTITVNTALFAAGDTVQITNLGAGVCTITAGTATVNSSASLALAQYESGTLDFTSTSAAIFIKGAGAAAASGGMTLISTTTLTGGTVNLSSIPDTYNKLQLFFRGLRPTSDNATTVIRVNGDTTASRYVTTSSSDNGNQTFADDLWTSSNGIDNTAATGFGMLEFYDYANTSTWKTALGYYAFVNATTTTNISYSFFRHIYNQTGAITEINLSTVGGGGANTWAGGTVLLYGVK